MIFTFVFNFINCSTYYAQIQNPLETYQKLEDHTPGYTCCALDSSILEARKSHLENILKDWIKYRDFFQKEIDGEFYPYEDAKEYCFECLRKSFTNISELEKHLDHIEKVLDLHKSKKPTPEILLKDLYQTFYEMHVNSIFKRNEKFYKNAMEQLEKDIQGVDLSKSKQLDHFKNELQKIINENKNVGDLQNTSSLKKMVSKWEDEADKYIKQLIDSKKFDLTKNELKSLYDLIAQQGRELESNVIDLLESFEKTIKKETKDLYKKHCKSELPDYKEEKKKFIETKVGKAIIITVSIIVGLFLITTLFLIFRNKKIAIIKKDNI